MRAVEQVTEKAGRGASLHTQVPKDRPLQDSILALVSLPAREELQEKIERPKPLSEAEAKALKETQRHLQKELSEIEFRLSGGLDSDQFNAQRKILTEAYSRPISDRVLLSICYVIAGTAAGFYPAIRLDSPVLAFAGAIAAAGIFNAFDISKTLFKRFKLANDLVFNRPHSPPPSSLHGIWNPLIRIRGFFHKGPVSPGAREYDKKIEAIEHNGGTPESVSELKEIAKEALELTREQTSRKLDLITSKLQAWETTWERQRTEKKEAEAREAGTAEAAKMFSELLASLSIPDSADKEFLKATASRLETLIGSVEAFMKERSTVPSQLPAMKYFVRIISVLEKNHVKEAGQNVFFDEFREALDARLREIYMAMGNFRGTGLPQTGEKVP